MNKTNTLNKSANVNYPAGDFLIRLKNAGIAGHKTVTSPNSNLIGAIAECLKKQGYLGSVEVKDGSITVSLAQRRKEPILMDIKIVSKPGLRVYMGIEEIEAKKGPTVLIISTSAGILAGKDAIKKRLGGELIAEVY